jgi:hypothetical protein
MLLNYFICRLPPSRAAAGRKGRRASAEVDGPGASGTADRRNNAGWLAGCQCAAPPPARLPAFLMPLCNQDAEGVTRCRASRRPPIWRNQKNKRTNHTNAVVCTPPRMHSAAFTRSFPCCGFSWQIQTGLFVAFSLCFTWISALTFIFRLKTARASHNKGEFLLQC